jgi:hypothetical protein
VPLVTKSWMFFHRLLNFLDVAHVPQGFYDGSSLRVFEPPAITRESRHDISYFLWPSFRVRHEPGFTSEQRGITPTERCQVPFLLPGV